MSASAADKNASGAQSSAARLAPIFMINAFGGGGCVSIIYGVGLLNAAAAYILAGVMALAAAYLLFRGLSKAPPAPEAAK